jgi:nucleoside-triphosphatase THEP1
MNYKLLITGPPRCGKSTLISKLIKYYIIEKKFVIHGFLTPEIREGGRRIGFDIQDIFSGNSYQLARQGDFKTKYRVGKYNVFIDEFDNYLEKLLDLDGKSFDMLVIDEIGKMELFSVKFQDFIKQIFTSSIPVLATIGLKLNHPLKYYLLNLPSIKILDLNRQNAPLVFQKVVSLIS